jgi:hypothetical protein
MHIEIASPIHTSSHYQSFETPFLHELVGGDRNMEQTNLVVTPDGKTWDEVTRDTSYIGCDSAFYQSGDGATVSSSGTNDIIFDECRGSEGNRNYYNKNFAIAYDRMICLNEGTYFIYHSGRSSADNTGAVLGIELNGTALAYFENSPGASYRAGLAITTTVVLKRGDYLQGTVGSNSVTPGLTHTRFIAYKVK